MARCRPHPWAGCAPPAAPPHTHTLTRGRAVFFARGEVARPVPGGGRGQLATDDWPDGQMAGGAGGGQWPPELDLDLMLHPPTGPTCTALPTRDPGPSLQPKAGCSKWGVRPAERVLTGHRPGRPVQAPRSLPGHDGPSPPPPSRLPLGNSPGVELTRAPQSQGPLRPPPRPRPHAATPGTVMGGGAPAFSSTPRSSSVPRPCALRSTLRAALAGRGHPLGPPPLALSTAPLPNVVLSGREPCPRPGAAAWVPEDRPAIPAAPAQAAAWPVPHRWGRPGSRGCPRGPGRAPRHVALGRQAGPSSASLHQFAHS